MNNLLLKLNTILLLNPIRNLILIGILYRLIIVVFFYSTVTVFRDSEGFTELAHLISNFNLKGYHGLRSLGYPIIISVLQNNLYFVVGFQFVLGILSSVLWYKILLNFNFNKRNSFYITLFLVTFINAFFFETCILVETSVLFLFSWLLFIMSKNNFQIICKSDILSMLFIFTYLVLIKPFYAYLPFIFILFFLLKKAQIKYQITTFIILIIFPLVAYFGWCYVNKLNTGYFAPTSYYGLTNAQTCVYFAEKTPKEWNWISEIYVKYRQKSIAENKDISMSIWYAYEDGAYDKYGLTFHELSAELGKFAKVAIEENPLDYAKQVVFRSWFDFWKPTIYWDYEHFNFKYANWLFLAIWWIQKTILIIFKTIFIFLIGFYGVKFLKTKVLSKEFMITFLVFSNSVLQAIVTYGTNDRYSFPFEFIIIIVVLLYLREKNWFSKFLY